ncbi:hypothetical protein KL86DPRO_20117 [uncultured delta proteobacterium]|uniref:DUF748 domain-containing protein n=1 Tax=uncultured delta proteobacterium TaxID=34034 RepID=A0A212JUZ9_9DELT|nr:hypothetical protein KL86DPRO_20117 [uncultured delta proteobacterium]
MADTDTRQQSRGFFRSLALTRKGRPGLLPWLAFFILLYAAGLGFLLPYFAKPFLEKTLSRELGVACTIGKLTVNPATLKITARDFRIPYPDAAREKTGEYLVRLKRLEMSPSLLSAAHKTLIVDDLRLVEPQFFLTRLPDGTLSTQLFFAGEDPREPNAEPEEEKEADLFPLVIHNITIRNGTLTVADAVHGARHTATNIDLSVPFASTLQTDRDVALTPTLSAVVNGRAITIQGESRPFASSRQTEFALQTRDLNLPDFNSYIRPYTSLDLTSGLLHTELTLRFEADAEKAFDVSLAGTMEITGLTLADKKNTVFSLAKASVDAENVIIGPRRIIINKASLEKPEMVIRRAKNGTVDWETFFFLPKDAPKSDIRITTSGGREVPIPGRETAPEQPHGLPLQLVLKDSTLTDGKITWQDNAPQPPVRYVMENIQGSFSDVSTDDAGSAVFSLSFGSGASTVSARGKATISPMRVECALDAKELPLPPFAPYVPRDSGLVLEGGTLSVAGDCLFQYRPELLARISKGQAALSGIKARTGGAGAPFLAVRNIAAERITADAAERTLHIGKISGTGIDGAFTRGKDGALMLPAFTPKPADARNGKPAPAPAPDKPWHISVDALAVGQSTFGFVDESLRRKAAIQLKNIAVSGKNFSSHGTKRWDLSVSAASGEEGKLSLAANGTLAPLNLTFSGAVEKADLRPLSPYLQEATRIRLREASLGGDFSGSVRRAPGTKTGGDFAVKGNLGVYGTSFTFRGKELGGWGRMRVENFDYHVPPSGRRACSIGSIAVNSPRLAVIIDGKGVSSLETALAGPDAPDGAGGPGGTDERDGQDGPEQGRETAERSPKEPFEMASFSIGKVAVSLGQATYQDNRVSPPYTLRMNQVTAALANLSLDPREEASLTGSLTINGSPVAVAAKAAALATEPKGSGTMSVRSLDLSRFTQYAEKYLGYPVRRGELTADTTATLKGRELTMRNTVLIRGLDLGKKVDSPHAPDMPLSAAVGILRDPGGNITLNLPVSGTIGDPEFKLGGVVAKVIANVIFKTVTSPFSLVGGVVSGFFNLFSSDGPTSAEIVFPIGEDTLDAVARDSLQQLGEELRKHPKAVLDVTGLADRGEKNVLVDAWVAKALRQRKYNALPPEEKAKTTPEAMIVGPEHNAREYSRLLFDLYKDLPFVKKSKDPETAAPQSTRAVMRILRSRLDIGEKELLYLARMRAVAVYHALCQGNIDIAFRIRLRESVLLDVEETGDRIASYARITVTR